MVYQMQLDEARAGDGAMRIQWAWHKIYDLIGQYIQTRSASLLAEIDSLAQRFQLEVPYGKGMGLPE
jgi:hypothetical protein